jgi:DNA-binding transcriptional LysR family regulator
MTIEDMRLFAKVAEAKSFTIAARLLGVPKQTLSRRISDLERALEVRLLHRTTRRLHLTEIGAAYADRCAEIVRLAEEANRAVTDAQQVPRGTLRVTADPVFGEAFLPALIVEFAKRWPEVHVEVVLTRRKVDLIEEGFDVAFRVGRVDDTALSGRRLGPARVRYCASPEYIASAGKPSSPADLGRHQCILVLGGDTPARWPFVDGKQESLVAVSGRLRFNSFAMAHAAALAGLGIAIFPEFACAEDIRLGRLVPVLDDWTGEVGAIWLLHPTRRYLTARVKAFVDLIAERLSGVDGWIAPERGPVLKRGGAKRPLRRAR